MIDLHFVPTPNGHKISIMLAETKLPHRLIQYDMLNGDHLKPEFRKVNPNGRLPAMVDHDPIGGGAPYPVFETGAMLFYLAEKSGQFLPSDVRRRHLAMQWLVWQVAGFGPMQGQAHHFFRYAPEDIDYAINRYINETKRCLDVLDRRLGEADYLAEEYSIADISTWPWVRATFAIKLDYKDWPNVKRWFETIAERPAVKEGAAQRMPSTVSHPGKAILTPEQWSNLFGENMLKSGKL